ncbi:MAG: hypothetical protein N2C14_20240, partial [Planctomycetales bacterium]
HPFDHRQERSNLVFTAKDGYGFHLLYNNFADGDDRTSYSSVGSDNYDDVVSVNLADNPILLPRAYFVDKLKAEDLVREFFQHGRCATGGIWKPESELHWDVEKGRLMQ